ncbi:MAG: PQQ-dependent sugar dehydrogenase [Phycisphaeraceae bacterium]|nr:PQQ-dependent sugar dehydrogenase [Phycisphaeraceae bacterium]
MNLRALIVAATLALLVRLAPGQQLATEILSTGLNLPIGASSPKGDPNRLFVVEFRRTITPGFVAGRIRVINLNTRSLQSEPYLITPRVATGNPEQGFLGLAFHPDFMANGYFYIVFNAPAEPGFSAGTTTLMRYRAENGDPLAPRADPNSGVVIMKIIKPDPQHNGGWIDFGPDGYLYFSTGDGGGSNDTNGPNTIVPPGHTPGTGNAQDLTDNLMGKILRIDVNGPDGIPGTQDDDGFPADPDRHYRIPPGNPFVGTPNDDEILHYGLRNPWRCSFDRVTGDLWIADVGQAQREEINVAPPGASGLNFGWRCMEGTRCTGLSGCVCDAANLTMPVYEYTRAGGCAVLGGYVYRGCAIPSLRGTYFYADYCTFGIYSFRLDGSGQVAEFTDRTTQLDPPGPSTIVSPIGFAEDDAGELYVLDFDGGKVLKVIPAVAPPDCNGNGVADSCDIAQGTSIDADGNGIPDECEFPCPADFNQDGGVDGQDVEAFYTAWENALPEADVNQDGGIDGTDVEVFFVAWEAGGC